MYSVLAQKQQLQIYAVSIKIFFPLASQNVTENAGHQRKESYLIAIKDDYVTPSDGFCMLLCYQSW
jgi:hypothetical protein